MDVSEKEVLRMLGYGGAGANERLSRLIRALTDELSARAKPKSAFGLWKVNIEPPMVLVGDMRICSASLAEHLMGASHAALLAATLGAQADALVRRYSMADMEKAAVINAVCAAMIEAYCDDIVSEIAKSDAIAGLCAAPRFSPGYGDFAIECQADILSVLNAGKRIGLTQTGGMMLAPTKSVVAVIGFGRDVKKTAHKCAGCDNADCEYRM